jgi:hypothetical protein
VLFGILLQRPGNLANTEPQREHAPVIPGQRRIAGFLLAVFAMSIGCVAVPGDVAATIDSQTACPPIDCGTTACDSRDESAAAFGCRTPACAGAHGSGAIGTGDVASGHDLLAATLSMGSLALGTVGQVANFFLPATAIGPSEVPPPGRFHPVPTHPVFSPASGP